MPRQGDNNWDGTWQSQPIWETDGKMECVGVGTPPPIACPPGKLPASLSQTLPPGAWCRPWKVCF